jgi:hypothetical protein
MESVTNIVQQPKFVKLFLFAIKPSEEGLINLNKLKFLN